MIPGLSNINLVKNILALALIIYSSYFIFQSYKVNWDRTQALVTQSSKKHIKNHTNKAGSYRYYFEYQYKIDGKAYESNNYTIGGRDKSIAVCKYKTGEKIKIFYDANNPEYALVSYHVSAFIWGVLLIGLLMLFHNILDIHLSQHKFDRKNKYFKMYRTSGILIAILIISGFALTIIKAIFFSITNGCF